MRSLTAIRRFAREVAPLCLLAAIGLISIPEVFSAPQARAQSKPAAPALAAAKAAPIEAPPDPLPAPPPAIPETRTSRSGRDVVIYPPLAAPPRGEGSPLVVMLHGMCCDPAPTCDFWSPAGREGSFLVCPAGNSSCGDAANWDGPTEERAAVVDESIALMDKTYGALIAHTKGDILMGYSRGAFVARDVIYLRPGVFKGLVLVAALMKPDAERLKASGIQRVVLAAGDYDGSQKAMRRAAAELSARGLPARFISLGRIGHWLPDNFEEIMRDALRWVRAGIPQASEAES